LKYLGKMKVFQQATSAVRKARFAFLGAILGYEAICGLYFVLVNPRLPIPELLVLLLLANCVAAGAFYISLQVLSPPLPRRQRVPWMIVAFLLLLVLAGWRNGTRNSVLSVILTLGVPAFAAFLFAHSYVTEWDVRRFLEPPPPSVSERTMEELANWRWLEHSFGRPHADGTPLTETEQRSLREARTQISRLEHEISGSEDEE
jgi:hypothetical protein